MKCPKDRIFTGDGAEEVCSLHSSRENSSDEDNDFYEKPDWVKIISVGRASEPLDQTENFFSPLHHSIKDLEASAQNGCHLCTLFWDLLSKKSEDMSKMDEARLRRAQGVIIVRPKPNVIEDDIDQQASQPLMLSVPYFLDGNCERESSYLFTIELELQFANSTPK